MINQPMENLRNALGSIDLTDIAELKDMQLDEAELMNRANDVELFYKSHFKKVLQLLIQKQLEFIGIGTEDENGNAIGVENENQLMFSRGTINGLKLIDDWMQQQINLSLSRFDQEDETN